MSSRRALQVAMPNESTSQHLNATSAVPAENSRLTMPQPQDYGFAFSMDQPFSIGGIAQGEVLGDLNDDGRFSTLPWPAYGGDAFMGQEGQFGSIEDWANVQNDFQIP